jgi:hypothetical protein
MNENIIFALLFVFNFAIIMLLVRQVAKKYLTKEQDKAAKPLKIRNLLQLLLPQVVLLAGAIAARISDHVLLPFILAIIISMGIIAVNTYYLDDYKFVQEAGSTGRIGYVISRLIPSIFFYFLFLFLVYGFNFEKMRSLFN